MLIWEKFFYNEVNIKDELIAYRSLLLYIGHENALIDGMTVEDNLLFWARMNNMELGLEATIHCFGLQKYLDMPVYMLSQGWQKKVSLARLLLSQAKIWLLDEPFANLDKNSVENLVNVILARCKQGGIAVVTSHLNPEFAEANILELADFQGEESV